MNYFQPHEDTKDASVSQLVKTYLKIMVDMEVVGFRNFFSEFLSLGNPS